MEEFKCGQQGQDGDETESVTDRRTQISRERRSGGVVLQCAVFRVAQCCCSSSSCRCRSGFAGGAGGLSRWQSAAAERVSRAERRLLQQGHECVDSLLALCALAKKPAEAGPSPCGCTSVQAKQLVCSRLPPQLPPLVVCQSCALTLSLQRAESTNRAAAIEGRLPERCAAQLSVPGYVDCHRHRTHQTCCVATRDLTVDYRPCATARSISCRCRDSGAEHYIQRQSVVGCFSCAAYTVVKGKRATRAHRRSTNVASFFPSFTIPPFRPSTRRLPSSIISFAFPVCFYFTVSSAGSAALAC